MRKFLLTLFAVLTASVAFAGDGTKGNPYTVADMQAMDVNNLSSDVVWIKAYIAGSANNKLENFVTTATGAVASNLMIADAQGETDYTKCAPVQLSSGSSARAALNLIDNPDNLGKTLLVQGVIAKYFSVQGVKNIAEFELSGEGVTPTPDPDPEKPDFSDYESLSVAQFLEKKDTETKFKLTGIVGSIKNTTYGNFNLVDLDNEDVYVYVYGLVDYLGTTKIWGSIAPKIEEKDTITVVGSYTLYNETTDEIVNAIYVEHKKFQGEKVSIKNTPETAYSIAKAVELINAGEGLSDEVYVKGTIKSIKSIDVEKYVRAQYWIADATTEDSIQVYNGYYLGGADFTANDQIKVGDEVIVYGQLTLYGTTYEVAANNYIYSLNGKTADDEPTDPYAKVEAISIADFLAKADTETQYKLTGVVRNIKNTTYGNFDLVDEKDENVSIYIYGVVKQDDLNNNKIWSSLDVVDGDILTIVGTYTTYNDNPQIAKAVYISHKKGSGPAVNIENTPETAYTVAQAAELIDAGKGLNQKVYVKGIISELVSIDVTRWVRAQYDIVDAAGSDLKLRIYNGYYLDGADFTADDQIKVGDEVVVYGQLTKYGDLYEVAANNYIYSLNGMTTGVDQIVNGKSSNGAIYDLSGRRVEKALKGIYIVNGKKVVF